MAEVEIRHSSLDSNAWVVLDCIALPSWGWRRRTRSNPIDGQADSGTATFAIAQADTTGIENPVGGMTVLINLHDFTTDAQLWSRTPSTNSFNAPGEGLSMAGRCTLGYLKALQEIVGGQAYLRLSTDNPQNNPSTTLYWIKSGVTGAPTSADREIPIEIDSIDLSPDSSADQSHMIAITISFREVRTSS